MCRVATILVLGLGTKTRRGVSSDCIRRGDLATGTVGARVACEYGKGLQGQHEFGGSCPIAPRSYVSGLI